MKTNWIIAIPIFCIFLVQATTARSQYYFFNDKYLYRPVIVELGGSVGIMNALTDLGGRKGNGKGFIKDLNWKTTAPSYSIYAIATYKEAVGLRLEASFGQVQGYDSILKNKDASLSGRYGRNLSFRSRIAELQLAAEIHPLFFKRYDEDKAPFISPYIVAGIGVYRFNPEAKVNGTWYALHPLRLEGQGFSEYPDKKPYRLTQINVPVGIGVKYEVSPLVNARLEVVHRILFTDYLDDVSTTYINPALFTNYLLPRQAAIATQLHSRRGEIQPGYTPHEGQQRGNSNNNDAFFSLQLKVGIALRPRR